MFEINFKHQFWWSLSPNVWKRWLWTFLGFIWGQLVKWWTVSTVNSLPEYVWALVKQWETSIAKNWPLLFFLPPGKGILLGYCPWLGAAALLFSPVCWFTQQTLYCKNHNGHLRKFINITTTWHSTYISPQDSMKATKSFIQCYSMGVV